MPDKRNDQMQSSLVVRNSSKSNRAVLIRNGRSCMLSSAGAKINSIDLETFFIAEIFLLTEHYRMYSA
jgi:hypothetical protein